MITRRLSLLCLFIVTSFTLALAATLRGRVVDSETGEALIGATLRIVEAARSATTNNDGAFQIDGLGQRRYTVQVSYLSYKTQTLQLNPARVDTALVIRLEPLDNLLGGATVVGERKRGTEVSQVAVQRNAMVVQSGVSGQQIRRSSDKDAAEAIRRVPGISLLDEKFVMVRGLSQRYNNVWINGSAVPSSEPDTRAFSFDIIPSSQIDNLQIIKSPAPQYPADFSGGFILLETRDVPVTRSASATIGTSVNASTHFRGFTASKAQGTDFLGFRSHSPATFGAPAAEGILDPRTTGFNNDWTVRRFNPAPDFNLGGDLATSHEMDNGAVLSLLGALSYNHSSKTYDPMENSLYSGYDVINDRSNYLRHSTDQQYARLVRLGGLFNLTFVPAKGGGRYEWKNIFNQNATDRYTYRTGVNAQSNREESAEYYYSARTVYNTQLAGRYVWAHSRFDWNGGYSFANRNMPDRRRYRVDNALDPERLSLPTGNDISREYTLLTEHIGSAGANYAYTFDGVALHPEVLAGVYGEYTHRAYDTRTYIYGWDPRTMTLPSGFQYLPVADQLLTPDHLGPNGLYMLDDSRMTDNYSGNRLVAAGYTAVNLTLGKLSAYAGVRLEHYNLELTHNTRDDAPSPLARTYKNTDLFPSVNLTYKFLPEHQLRLAYGRSVNRPEFREVSPSVFYDFDLAAAVQGNVDLKNCYVDNLDLRYEWYPAPGDQISIAGFYKRFSDPIEWTYTVSGGTDLIYSYENARSAYSVGIELDVRKNLAFLSLPQFTLVFNGSLIRSRVDFNESLRGEENRPMQGQSPYLVNAGLFFTQDSWSASLLYNRIGKRLIGVGRNMGSTGDQTVRVPSSYEMPRNSLDLSLSKAFGRLTLRLGAKDLMGEKVYFKQISDVTLASGQQKTVEEVTRSYRPGRNFSLAVTCKF